MLSTKSSINFKFQYFQNLDLKLFFIILYYVQTGAFVLNQREERSGIFVRGLYDLLKSLEGIAYA